MICSSQTFASIVPQPCVCVVWLSVAGKSATAARFSEPGEYVIQGVVDDGSLFAGTYCCWVSREVTVSVK